MVFRGVTKGGKTATFTVAAETILQGDGKCLPSAIQCEAVQLQGRPDRAAAVPQGGHRRTSRTTNCASSASRPRAASKAERGEHRPRAVEGRHRGAAAGEPDRHPGPRDELARGRARPHFLSPLCARAKAHRGAGRAEEARGTANKLAGSVSAPDHGRRVPRARPHMHRRGAARPGWSCPRRTSTATWPAASSATAAVGG